MNPILQLQQSFLSFLQNQFTISLEKATQCALIINTDDSKREFGDFNTNAALVLAKELKRNPREIAQAIVENFHDAGVEKIEIAGAGFVNIFLKITTWQTIAAQLFDQKQDFFKPDIIKDPHHFSIEFVSANPTGPLHFGHGRSGIIGDVLGNILRFTGNTVTKEFYINDAGNQIQKLGISFKIRCQQLLGIDVQIPEDGYHGTYLVDLAQECIAQQGNTILEKDMQFFQDYAKDILLKKIKNTLQEYGITFDVWFSEKTLHIDRSVQNAIDTLSAQGHLYEKEGALWFKSTDFGDDKDRVIRKSTGEWTYIAADVAYLLNKVKRGFNPIVLVLGHDHHSYGVRLEGIRKALGLDHIQLDTILYQLVRIKEGGELVRLSKRAGAIISLDDVIESVGKDVARFFYLHRKADAHLEFDLELARKKTDENPVYYVQYAYVRIGSVLQKAQAENIFALINSSDARFLEQSEVALLKKIISLKDLLAHISTNYQTHLLTYYIVELADIYHRYYSQHRIIELENMEQSRGRLLLMQILRQTMAIALDLLGISKPERM